METIYPQVLYNNNGIITIFRNIIFSVSLERINDKFQYLGEYLELVKIHCITSNKYREVHGQCIEAMITKKVFGSMLQMINNVYIGT